MRLLVIGASGFIGGHLIRTAKRHGFRTLGTTYSARHDSLLKFNLATDRIGSCVGSDFFKGLEKTVVVIAASLTDMDRCLTDPGTAMLINVSNTIRTVEEVSELGAKVVFLSTGHVFDGRKGCYREIDKTHPVNEYARHKLEVEQFLRSKVPGSFIARLDKVVGDNPAEHHLFSEWLDLLKKRNPIICIQDMEISPTFVGDVTEGLIRACEIDLGGTYHLAGPEQITRDQLARRFCKAAGFPEIVLTRKLEDFNFRDARALRSSLVADKFCNETGFRFSHIDETISNFLRKAGLPAG